MEYEKSVSKWYDSESTTYDDARLKLKKDRERHAIECSLLSLYLKGRVLEIGCGTGRYAHFLKKRGAEIVVVDLSKNMLLEAKGLDRVRASAYNLPFRKTCFNGIYLIRAFKFMSPNKTLNEIRRVISPQGIFIMIMASIECAYCCRKVNSNRYNRFLHNRRILHLYFRIFGYPLSLSWKETGSNLLAITYSKKWFEQQLSKIGFYKPQFGDLFAYYRLLVYTKKKG